MSPGRFKSSFLPPSAAGRKEFCEDTSRSGKGRPPSALLLGADLYIALTCRQFYPYISVAGNSNAYGNKSAIKKSCEAPSI
jgi:hypothetical protein